MRSHLEMLRVVTMGSVRPFPEFRKFKYSLGLHLINKYMIINPNLQVLYLANILQMLIKNEYFNIYAYIKLYNVLVFIVNKIG